MLSIVFDNAWFSGKKRGEWHDVLSVDVDGGPRILDKVSISRFWFFWLLFTFFTYKFWSKIYCIRKITQKNYYSIVYKKVEYINL